MIMTEESKHMSSEGSSKSDKSRNTSTFRVCHITDECVIKNSAKEMIKTIFNSIKIKSQNSRQTSSAFFSDAGGGFCTTP